MSPRVKTNIPLVAMQVLMSQRPGNAARIAAVACFTWIDIQQVHSVWIPRVPQIVQTACFSFTEVCEDDLDVPPSVLEVGTYKL
jgi:hypothetical protein